MVAGRFDQLHLPQRPRVSRADRQMYPVVNGSAPRGEASAEGPASTAAWARSGYRVTGKKLQRHGHRIRPGQERLMGQMIVVAPGDLMTQAVDPDQNDRCRAIMKLHVVTVERAG